MSPRGGDDGALNYAEDNFLFFLTKIYIEVVQEFSIEKVVAELTE
jgi:hypothetical protein